MRILFLVVIFISISSCKDRFYRAPSNSMAATIRKGEVFSVKKQKEFQRNDIVVFKYFGTDYSIPMDENGHFKQDWQQRFCRLIAKSGDLFQIKNGEVILNGEIIKRPPTSVGEYDVYSKTLIDDFPPRIDEQEIPYTISGDTVHYRVTLTVSETENYKSRKNIIRINEILMDHYDGDTALIQSSETSRWSVDNFGPVKIPAPAEIVDVTKYNYKLFRNIKDIHFGKNKIAENLYFVIGDARHYCEDSRFIGFIPQSNMVGIVK